MKGISDIVLIVLILLIVVALASLVYTFLFGTFSSLEERGTEEVTHMTEAVSSCMFVDSMHQNKVYLRNCGKGVIANSSLNIYINDEKFNFEMTPSSIKEGQLATISLPLWGISAGEYQLRITNPKTEALAIFEAELPDSCILALDFDEGGGTIAHDKSGYGNDATLIGNTNWTKGKYGNGLKFDGMGDHINISSSDSLELNEDFTIELWFNTISTSSQHIVNKYYWSSKPGFYIRYVNNEINFRIHDGSVFSTTVISFTPDGKWHHTLGIRDNTSTDNLYIYLDGLGRSPVTDTTTSSITSDIPLRVGIYGDGSIEPFNGTIDSVRIYDETLTPEETIVLKMK